MPVTLTATPLPGEAAVRLHASASVPAYPTVVSETLTGLDAAAILATASRWTTFGPWNWRITANGVGAFGSLQFQAYTMTTPGTYPARSHGVRRTISGLTVGQRYLVYIGLDPSGAYDGPIEVSMGGATTVLRHGMPDFEDDGAWPVGQNSGAMPDTPYVLDFTATATSHVMEFTNLAANQPIQFGFIWLRVVPVVTGTTLTQSDFMADDTSVTLTATAPAGLSATRVFEPVGNIAARFAPTSGPVVVPTHLGLMKVLTGLTVGVRYRVTVAAAAGGYIADKGDGTGIGWSGPWRLSISGTSVAPESGPSTWLSAEFVATSPAASLSITFKFAQSLAAGDTASLRLGYLRLDSVPDADDAYTLRTFTRADANGTRPVRIYEGSDLSAGEFVATDFEPSMLGPLVYSVEVFNSITGTTETATATATLDGAVTRARIAPASLPSQGEWYDLAPGLTLGRETTTTVAQVINRPDPLVTLGSQTLRRGTLKIWAPDYQAGTALERVFNAGETVLLRQPDYLGQDMYIVGTSTSLDLQPETTDPRRWILEVEYTEVAAPTTPLRGSIGWTIAASTARNPTLAASRAEFPTVLDLLIGPQ